MLLKQGRLDQAQARCKDVLATQRRVLGRKHPDCLLTSQTLAKVLTAKEQFKDAKAMYAPRSYHTFIKQRGKHSTLCTWPPLRRDGVVSL